ncbi:MAG: hypothetical protein PVG11_05070 [Anaerolineae bacterium]|jgi:pimeloyl-ACP methyl ester carboxylesterase
MDTNDLLTQWSTLSLDEIEARLASGEESGAVDQLFGPEEAEALRSLATTPAAEMTRRAVRREAVVLLPGVMGSLLSSVRGVTKLLWINPMLFVRGESSYLELTADGERDLHPEVDVVPTALEKLSYTKAGLALRRHVDLYEFPYDWRRPIEWNGDLLGEYLERWAGLDETRQFTLVGHSMGGLVSRAYLARHPAAAERLVKRLIMHGSPQFGAAQAVENLYVGNRMMDIAGLLNQENDPRHLLINMPSVYQILPAPPDLFPDTRLYPADWDLYDAAAWRLAGIRQDYLELGRRFHQLLAGADPQVEIVQIAGCNLDTMVEVRRAFVDDERLELRPVWMGEGPDAGDGTVPLWSALLPGAQVYYVQEKHRNLSKNGDVIDATLALIHDGTPDLPDELPPRRSGLFRAAPQPVEAEAASLRQRLEAGQAREEDLEKLFFAF